MSSLPSIFELCTPRQEVLAGDLPDSLFAADLWEVIEGKAHPDYQNPQQFFANPYPTESLARLLKDVGERLSGAGDVTSVFRLETGFGGGKTHSLIAAVHIAREGNRLVQTLADYRLARLPEPGATRVAAFVGDQSDPQQGLLREEGANQFRTFTPWGEIAYQLGGRVGYEEVRANDEQGGAPSRQALERAFGDGPILILIDELVLYLARALALPADHPRHHVVSQLPTFLQTLFTLAAQRPKTSVIFTLPTEQDANRRVTAEFRQLIPQVLEAVDELTQTAGRQAANLTPTQSHERAAVLGRRLFRSVDRGSASAIAAAYQQYYGEQKAAGVDIEGRAFERDYGQQLENSYPFHPELIRLFATRLAEINEFQATRGALRLIARTIRYVWADRDRWKNTLLLHPYHVDLTQPELQDELLSRLGRLAFRPALEEDVVRSEGGTHAALVEEGWPVHAATESALTVFLHSLPEGSRGLTAAEVALAVGRPGYDLAYVSRGLEETERQSWYMYVDAGRYFFRARASVNKRFQERARDVQPGEIREQLDQWVEEVFSGFENFQVVIFPQDQTALPDSAERLRLVLVHYDKEVGYVGGGNRLDFTKRLFESKGVDRLPRTYKNNIVFLLAEGNRVEGLKETVRTLIAWERVRQDLESEQKNLAEAEGRDYRPLKEAARRGGAGVSPEFMALENDLASVLEKLGPQELSVRTRLLDAYRVVAFPPSGAGDAYAALFDTGAGRAPLECYRVDFGEVPQTGRLRKAGPGRAPAAETPILEALRQNNKLVPVPQPDSPVVLAPAVLRQPPLWQTGERKISTEEAWERLRRNSELPMLLRASDLLPTFRAGLTQPGDPLWYYYDASKKRVYVKETAAELSPILSGDHYLYDIRSAVLENIVPVRQVAPADLWNKVWPRENGERLPKLTTDRLYDALSSSAHFPVLPSREVVWRGIQEGARENRWVLYLPGLNKAIGAQEMDEWPSMPRFEVGVELWQYQAALDAGLYPRRTMRETAVELLNAAALRRKCWPEGAMEIPTEDIERFARGVWADVSRSQLEVVLQEGVRTGQWGAWFKGEPEAFLVAGDLFTSPIRVGSEWALVLPDSSLARDLDGVRPGRGPQPVTASGTPREALTSIWEQLQAHRNVEVSELRLTVSERGAYDNTLLVTWADRPSTAANEAVVHAEGAREVDGRREGLSLDFSGRFEEIRALLAPVWPFARGGQLSVEITLVLRFDPPVSLEEPALATYRTALMNANQGQLEAQAIPVRRPRGSRS